MKFESALAPEGEVVQDSSPNEAQGQLPVGNISAEESLRAKLSEHLRDTSPEESLEKQGERFVQEAISRIAKEGDLYDFEARVELRDLGGSSARVILEKLSDYFPAYFTQVGEADGLLSLQPLQQHLFPEALNRNAQEAVIDTLTELAEYEDAAKALVALSERNLGQERNLSVIHGLSKAKTAESYERLKEIAESTNDELLRGAALGALLPRASAAEAREVLSVLLAPETPLATVQKITEGVDAIECFGEEILRALTAHEKELVERMTSPDISAEQKAAFLPVFSTMGLVASSESFRETAQAMLKSAGSDEDAKIEAIAALRFSDDKKTVRALRSFCRREEDPELREAAVMVLASFQHPAARKAILNILKDPSDAKVFAGAARAVGSVFSLHPKELEEARERITSAFHEERWEEFDDQSKRVLLYVATQLELEEVSEKVRDLLRTIPPESDELRYYVNALYELRPDLALQEFNNIPRESLSQSQRLGLIDMFFELEDVQELQQLSQAARETLLAAAEEERRQGLQYTSRETASALGEYLDVCYRRALLGDEQVFAELRLLSAEASDFLRRDLMSNTLYLSTLALGRNKEDLTLFVATANNEALPRGVRKEALEGLGMIPGSEAAAALSSFLESPYDSLRVEAATHLAYKDDKKALAVLTEFLPHADYQEQCVDALMLSTAPEAAAALLAQIGDMDIRMEMADSVTPERFQTALRALAEERRGAHLEEAQFFVQYADALHDAKELGISKPFMLEPAMLTEIVARRNEPAAHDRPLAIFVAGTHDHNGYSYNAASEQLAGLLQQGYQVLYYQAQNERELIEHLHTGKDAGGKQAELVVISGHGSAEALALGAMDPAYGLRKGEEAYLDITDVEELKQANVESVLAANGRVIFWSCSVGQGGKDRDNVVNMGRDIFPQAEKGGISGPMQPVYRQKLTFDEEGKAVMEFFQPTLYSFRFVERTKA